MFKIQTYQEFLSEGQEIRKKHTIDISEGYNTQSIIEIITEEIEALFKREPSLLRDLNHEDCYYCGFEKDEVKDETSLSSFTSKEIVCTDYKGIEEANQFNPIENALGCNELGYLAIYDKSKVTPDLQFGDVRFKPTSESLIAYIELVEHS